MRPPPIATVPLLVLLGVAGAVHCSSPDEPPSYVPTLFVKNPLCDATGCPTIQIRAFVPAFTIPQHYWGMKVVGETDARTECLQLPASWTVNVYQVDSTGESVGDTTVYTWTPDHPDGIYLTAREPPGGLFAMTETFVPAEAPGWTVSFSEDSIDRWPYTAHLTPTEACVPP